MTDIAPPADRTPAEAASVPRAQADLRFYAMARLGHSEWWRFVIGFFSTMFVVIVGSAACGIAVTMLEPQWLDTSFVKDWRDVGHRIAMLHFAFFMMPFGLFLLGILIVTAYWHQRPVRSLMTGHARFRWRLAGLSAAVTFGIAVLFLLLDLLLPPHNTEFVLDASAFLSFLPLVLILVPLQVLAEEVIFRGYLLQIVGRYARRPAVVVLVPSLLFWGVHLANDPVQLGGFWAVIDYGIISFYLTYVAVRGNGLEHCFGLHLGINLFVFTILGIDNAWYPTPTLFLVGQGNFAIGAVATALICGAHYWLVLRPALRREA